MRISFDLDDTLICHAPGVPAEPNRIPFLLRRWFPEPLRLGTRDLFTSLRQQGHELWIYTTSLRSPLYIRTFFHLHGIRITRVVNQSHHDRITRDRPHGTKAPHLFGISLHVDDSEGVAEEGRHFGFRVIVINPSDTQWTEKIRTHLQP